MFNDINLSNALALIDKPVWVITEVRGRNKNNRTYSKSRSKNVIYPATITNVQVWRGYSHSKGDTGCPKCTSPSISPQRTIPAQRFTSTFRMSC